MFLGSLSASSNSMKMFLLLMLIAGVAAGAELPLGFKKIAERSDMILHRFDEGRSLTCLKGNWSDFSRDKNTQSFMRLVFGMEGDDSLIIFKDEGKVTYTAYKLKGGGIQIDGKFVSLENIFRALEKKERE